MGGKKYQKDLFKEDSLDNLQIKYFYLCNNNHYSINYVNFSKGKQNNVIRSPQDWKDQPPRVIYPNFYNPEFPPNKIKTSKYNLINFIPLNLYEQFTKMANIYFLVVGILQMIPVISITNGVPTEYSALIVIVILTAIKDLYEDLQRHRADRKENHKIYKTNQGDKLCQDLMVGDIITICQNQKFPSDILLLNQNCFVETSQLDGESNLKEKKGITELIQNVKAEQPNPYLYQFNATINDLINCDETNLILRGCTLKSQTEIQGIIIYSGHQSKIMLNQHNPRGKVTELVRLTNKMIIQIWMVQLVLCMICATLSEDELKIKGWFVSVGNWLLLFVNFIPISLLLTMEMIRYCQGLLMAEDITNIGVQASNLNDDLGQIQHIFTDKTGTLTQNKMTLREIFVNGVYQSHINGVNIFSIILLTFCNDIKVIDGQLLLQSSDEQAFHQFFQQQGYTIKYQNKEFILSNSQETTQIKILSQINFSSSRKRMSVFIEYDNKIYLLIKGADSVIFQRSQLNQKAVEAVNSFSSRGYRALVFGYKSIDYEDYERWLEIKDLQQQEEIEQGFSISLVTGVEDILQDNVAQTIYNLQEANMNFWILTGDHVGTALSVAHATHLLEENEVPLVFSISDISLSSSQITQSSLIIQGNILMELQHQQKLDLIRIARRKRTVLWCRISPKQKREIVLLFRECYPQICTLAIGDGANDVNMITEANVGVGVIGEEGMQAARASDYFIEQFSQLERLLLYHGRECYRRNGDVIVFNFYKNVLYLIPQFCFGFMSGFSAQSLYDLYVFQCYNFMYTSLPILIYGILDIKYNNADPIHYNETSFDNKQFWIQMIEGAGQSIIIYLFCFYGQISEDTLVLQGQLVFLVCVIIANLYVLLISHDLPLLQIITQFLSFFSYTISMIIANFLPNYSLRYAFGFMLQSIDTYLILMVCTLLCLTHRIANKLATDLVNHKIYINERFSQSTSNQISLQEQSINKQLLNE